MEYLTSNGLVCMLLSLCGWAAWHGAVFARDLFLGVGDFGEGCGVEVAGVLVVIVIVVGVVLVRGLCIVVVTVVSILTLVLALGQIGQDLRVVAGIGDVSGVGCI